MSQKIHKIGRVYSLRSPNTNDIYIGSTFNPLYKRLGGHKIDFGLYQKKKGDYITSYKIIEKGEPYIELIEQYENLTKEQLNRHEGEFIRAMDCVNKCVAGRTKKEYRDDKKEMIELKDKEYRDNHKNDKKEYDAKFRKKKEDEIKKKIKCECSGTYQNKNKNKHFKTKQHCDYISSL